MGDDRERLAAAALVLAYWQVYAQEEYGDSSRTAKALTMYADTISSIRV